MRIKLPNPNEYLHREDLFFGQLELAIYHAKKSWAKIKKQYDPENKDDYPWLAFRFEKELEDAIDDARDKHGVLVDPNFELRQDITLAIEEL